MNRHLLAAAILAVSASACAQTQSGSGIGSSTGGSAAASLPAPLPVPSTGTSADAAATQGTTPRTSEPLGTSGPIATRPLREQASTGTTGPTSTGASSGATR